MLLLPLSAPRHRLFLPLVWRFVFWGLLIAIFFIAGCAQTPRAGAKIDAETQVWTGRLSLQVQSEPPQSFSAGFELRGDPYNGELVLNSPLGNSLGVLRWSPGQASLNSGSETTSAASVDELIEKTTGAAVPLSALFDWLDGKPAALNGWTADLTQQPSGRISARRLHPLPPADLRLILER